MAPKAAPWMSTAAARMAAIVGPVMQANEHKRKRKELHDLLDEEYGDEAHGVRRLLLYDDYIMLSSQI